MFIMLLLKVASVACVVVGYRTWRWYSRRAHQGLQTEEQEVRVSMVEALLHMRSFVNTTVLRS